MTGRYARRGSEAFNARLADVFQRLETDVSEVMGGNLVALILGGGYGRGEGGIVQRDGIEMAYNDIDLLIVVRHKRAIPQKSLKRVRKKYEDELKIHIDMSRPVTTAEIRHWPRSMMWFDLLNGHQVLHGSPSILTDNAPKSVGESLPAEEATRLMLNRGAGLLGAMTVVRGIDTSRDPDFSRRNYFKCALALGDAVTAVHGRYTTQCSGRDERFAQLAHEDPEISNLDLVGVYAEALRFKFFPDRVSKETMDEKDLASMAEKWGAVFLYVERVRTGLNWPTLHEYIQWNGIREKEQNGWTNVPRNIVRNRQLGKWSRRYPREELYRRLPVLLEITGPAAINWPDESMQFLDVWYLFS